MEGEKKGGDWGKIFLNIASISAIKKCCKPRMTSFLMLEFSILKNEMLVFNYGHVGPIRP